MVCVKHLVLHLDHCEHLIKAGPVLLKLGSAWEPPGDLVKKQTLNGPGL